MVGKGNLISLICSLSADGSVLGPWYNWCQLTSVWPALLLMRAVERRCSLLKSYDYMCKCGRPLSLKPPSPLSTFVRIRPDPPSPSRCGRPLWMTPYNRQTVKTSTTDTAECPADVAQRPDWTFHQQIFVLVSKPLSCSKSSPSWTSSQNARETSTKTSAGKMHLSIK